MTQDEIRKLLGGYATNALTAEERQTLFEAALEDQELFNALKNEDELRELLADPVFTGQVRQALEHRRPRYWSRRWVLGVALPAVAAVIIIAVMDRENAPRPAVRIAQAPAPSAPAEPAPIATEQAAPAPQAKKQPARKQTIAPPRIESKASPVIPAAPAPRQLESARVARPALAAPAVANFRAIAPPPVLPAGVRQQFSAGLATSAPLYQGPLVRYSLLRTGPAGNSVRVEVTIGIAGYLALYQLDAAGNSKRVYPSGNPAGNDRGGNNDLAAPVLPNQAIEIPANPIEIGVGSRLRLVVVPSVPPVMNQFAGAAGATTLGTGNAPIQLQTSQGQLSQAQPAPLVVDIPLSPN